MQDQNSVLNGILDAITGEWGYPKTAREMSDQYPRPNGIRCDSAAVRAMEVGDDPRMVPFGQLPNGWPKMLDSDRYESTATHFQMGIL